ncbi:MAG TPA: S-layer homology domain-containing protein [Clostridiales bacterium]|nr:S-layer homology domain-containing protein [Clostridiales bacterium]
MRKRIAFMLCAVLLAATVLAPAATRISAADRAAEVINALGIMETDRDFNAPGTSIVTRSKFSQMLVNLSTVKNDIAGESNVSLFKDVRKTHWASGYIQTAVTKGWMSGYLNGTFRPTQGINLQEAVYGVLALLGYSNSDFAGSKVNAIMKLYKSKGLDKNIDKGATDLLTVNDCVNLFYNTLNTTNKAGTKYASVLGYTLDSKGNIDYLSLINTGVEGPVIAKGGWYSEIPFSVSMAQLYKNGVACKYTDIDAYDVLYYSKSFKTIWIYDSKITGTIGSINPNYTAPSSVTIGGTEYSFADTDVALRFSAMGDLKEGRVVTLLLGKDKTVVGVLDIDEYNVTMTGYVLSTGTHIVEDEKDNYRVSDYVTFVDAAGNEYTQDYDSSQVLLGEGSLVQVKFVDGTASVSSYTAPDPVFSSYTFSSDGLYLGNTALASDVKILDLKKNRYTSVIPERLANASIGSSSILYYAFNDSRQISELILKGATGDLDSYGIFTGMSYGNSTTYNYIIDGTSQALVVDSSASLNLDEGPSGFVLEDGILTSSYALTGVKVSSIGVTTVQANNEKYTLANKYDVYLYLDKKYVLTTLDKVSNLTKYTVMAYYDKPTFTGGRIRIIIAAPK